MKRLIPLWDEHDNQINMVFDPELKPKAVVDGPIVELIKRFLSRWLSWTR